MDAETEVQSGGRVPLSLSLSVQAHEDPLAGPSPVPTSQPGFALGALQGSKLTGPPAPEAPASLKGPSIVCAPAGRACPPQTMRLKSSRCCHQLCPPWSPGQTPPAHRALSKWGPPPGSQGVRGLGEDG